MISDEPDQLRERLVIASAPNIAPVRRPRAFSVDQFCQLYGVGRTLAYAEIKAERLLASKAGRRTLISFEAAEAWLAALPPLKEDGR
jgi:hypothetical protein